MEQLVKKDPLAKFCPGCRATRSAGEFYVVRATGGLQSRCIACQKLRMKASPEQKRERALARFAKRFWLHIARGPGCWEWARGRLQKSGYGMTTRDGKAVLAHRAAWELVNGPVPNGMFVLHKCDNPPCCNPDHLFIGTQADNMADAKKKGRLRGFILGRAS